MLVLDLIEDKISESISLASTLKLLASDIGNPISELYSKLESMAHKYSENNDNMGGFRLLEKGVLSKWLNEEGQHLIAHLHHLADQAPSQAASSLRMLLRGPFSRDIRHMAESLTPILMQIGRDTNYEHLVRNAQAWQHHEEKYQRTLEHLDNYAKTSQKMPKQKMSAAQSISDRYAEIKDREEAEKKAARAKSQQQAEQLVNNVLRALPSGIAGEIRNSIARDSNKLYALQRELSRRNIKI